jgi:hypothetical protein
MTDVFVIRNQLGHYWGKSKAWVDGSQPRLVVRTAHRDEAVNTLFELSSKDFELRGEVVAAQLGERGEPVIEPSQIPLPMDPGAEESCEAVDIAQQEGQDSPRGSVEPAEPVA